MKPDTRITLAVTDTDRSYLASLEAAVRVDVDTKLGTIVITDLKLADVPDGLTAVDTLAARRSLVLVYLDSGAVEMTSPGGGSIEITEEKFFLVVKSPGDKRQSVAVQV